MSGWTGRTRLCAVLSVVAIGIAACGGSSNKSSAYSGSSTSSTSGGGSSSSSSTSPQQYAQQIATATAPVRTAIDQIGQGSSSVDTTASAQCAAAAPGVVTAINNLSPPSKDASLQPQLAAAVTKLGNTCSALHDAIVKHDASALKTLGQQGNADQTALNDVLKQINSNAGLSSS
jgi:hypothetical protein